MVQLEQWYQEQYILFLVVGLVIVLVEFAVLLSTILSCIKVYKHKNFDNVVPSAKIVTSIKETENTYKRAPFSYSNEAYTMSNSFRQNYKLVDKT